MVDSTPVDAAFLAELGAEAEALPDTPDENANARLKSLAEQVALLDTRIAKGEALLKSLKAERHDILSRQMVDAMGGVTEAIEEAGLRFELMEYVKATIPDEHIDEACEFLEGYGAGALIKRRVEVAFPVGFEEETNSLLQYVRERYQMADVLLKRGAHWATLTSWVKEQRKARADALALHATDPSVEVPPELPAETLGISAGPLVKVSASKARKNR